MGVVAWQKGHYSMVRFHTATIVPHGAICFCGVIGKVVADVGKPPKANGNNFAGVICEKLYPWR